jgi:hypothetical protein
MVCIYVSFHMFMCIYTKGCVSFGRRMLVVASVALGKAFEYMF